MKHHQILVESKCSQVGLIQEPAYFILAEANIGPGGARLKKAEEFLIAAYWNLLKITQDEGGKGGGNEDSLVDDKELDRY